MIDFLLALFLICGILAIPPLRRIAIWLIGGIVIIFVAIMVFTPAFHPASQTLTPSQSAAAAMRQQASDAAKIADETSKHLIGPHDVEIGQLGLISFGRPLDLILPSLDDVAIAVVVRNLSPRYTLTEMDMTAGLFDCPAEIAAIGPQCDQIGQFEDRVRAVIPPGQVREMRGPGLGSIRNLPPLRGHLMLNQSIGWIRAALPAPAGDQPLVQ